MFQPFHNSPGLHEGVLPCAGVGSQEGDLFTPLSEQLVIHSSIGPSSSNTSQAPSLSLSGLRIVIIWEKYYLVLSPSIRYLRMLIDITQERVCLADSWECQSLRCGSRFSATLFPWNTLFPRTCPAVAVEESLVCLGRWSSNASPLYGGSAIFVSDGVYWRRDGSLESFSRWPLPPPPPPPNPSFLVYISASQTSLGAHLQDLTSWGEWFSQ